MIGFILLSLVLFVGFYAPNPPGIFGILIEYYLLGGKEKERMEREKWYKINEAVNNMRKKDPKIKNIHDILLKKGQD